MRALALFLVLLLPLQVSAAPTEFNSTSFRVTDLIFGGTGFLRSNGGVSPPTITSGPTASTIGDTTATIAWQTNVNTLGTVQIGVTSGTYAAQAYSSTTVPDRTNHSVQLSGLTKGVTYFVRLTVVDAFGNTVVAPEFSFTTQIGDVTPPAITTGPSVAQNAASAVTITWETNELSGSIVTYGIESASENRIGDSDERVTFHQIRITGIAPGQTYLFRVESRDDAGNIGSSAVASFTTQSAPGIAGVEIRDITLSTANVEWRTSVPATTLIEYGTRSGDYTTEVENTELSETHFVRLTGLTSGTTYYARLSGVDANGKRLQSDEYVFRSVTLPSITSVVVTEITADSALVRWEATSEVDGIVQYVPRDSASGAVPGVTAVAELKRSHEVRVTGLFADTEYSLSVTGRDAFGNQALPATATIRTGPDTTPPVIESLRTDTTVDFGSRQSVQVLVSFGLSEPGKAVLEYGEGAAGPMPQRVETDDSFSSSKFLVIPGLRPGDSYHFRIVATDRGGNRVESPEYLVLAPTQPVSLLDLIFGQVQRNFGWLSNLGG